MQVQKGLAAIVAPCAGRLLTAIARAQQRADAVTLHRMRVCARRLRAALSILRGVLPSGERKRLRSGLRWLIHQTGPARDWDVLVGETLHGPARHGTRPDVQAILDAAAVRQARARRRAMAALAGTKCARLVSDVERLVSGCRRPGETMPWRGDARRWRRRDKPLHSLADAALRKRHKKLCRLIAATDTLDRDGLHRLRIRIRMQRYTAELAAVLYPRNAVARYVSELKSLQRNLGAIHDLQMAQTLISGLTAVSRQGVRRLELQCAARLAGQESRLKEFGPDAAMLKPFWD